MASVIDIHGLAPLQEGMLFHTLYGPESGVYVEQRWCVILESHTNVARHKHRSQDHTVYGKACPPAMGLNHGYRLRMPSPILSARSVWP